MSNRFVRFDQITKAEQVLHQLSDSAHNGLKFVMTPAKDRKKGESSSNSAINGPMRSPPNYRHRHPSSGSSDGASSSKNQPMHGHHLSRSRDCHMIDTPSNVKNRFRGLINELDPDNNLSDSDDSSIMDYGEWERVLDSVPSVNQIVSRSAPSKFSEKYRVNGQNGSPQSPMVSCDQSHDHTHHHVTSNGESLCWDMAPLSLSGPAPLNKMGLVRAHVSEVYTLYANAIIHLHACVHIHKLKGYFLTVIIQ